jgi:hypothetical protein
MNSILSFRNKINNENVTKAVILCNPKILQTHELWMEFSIQDVKYIIYKAGDNTNYKVIDVRNFIPNAALLSFDLLLRHYNCHLETNLQGLLDKCNLVDENNSFIEKLKLLVGTNFKTVLNSYFNISSTVIKKELTGLAGDNIVYCKKGLLGLKLFNLTGSIMLDLVKFNKTNIDYTTCHPEGSLLMNVERIFITKSLDIYCDPRDLINNKYRKGINNPFVFMSRYTNGIAVDKVFTLILGPKKEMLNDLNISIICSEISMEYSVILRVVHYFLNTMIDYVHFNEQIFDDFTIVNISWKVGEGLTSSTRIGLSNSLKIEVYKMIYDQYYSHLAKIDKFSDNVDVLLESQHTIEKYTFYVNRKKDIVSYKIKNNKLSMICYCKYILDLFKINSVNVIT